jgi:acetyl-CoA C-acetyltransferase
MSKVFIVAAKRTALGSFGGSLAGVDAATLGATAIKGALTAAGVAPEQVDEVIVGNVITAGQGMGRAARQRFRRAYPLAYRLIP